MEQFFAGLTHLMPWIVSIVGLWMLPGIIVSGIVATCFVFFLIGSALEALSKR